MTLRDIVTEFFCMLAAISIVEWIKTKWSKRGKRGE